MGGQTTPRERDFKVNKENTREYSVVVVFPRVLTEEGCDFSAVGQRSGHNRDN